MADQGTTIGDNIKALRNMRKMSRPRLAEAISISESYLKKIENGERSVTSTIATRIAQTLKVGVDRIYGQPYYNGAEADEGVQAVIPDLRRVLWTYDSPEDLSRPPRPFDVLVSEMETISQLRQDGKYVQLAPLLPSLITELTHVALAAPAGEVQEQAYWYLARGYRAANSLAHKLGHPDLSMTAIERVRWAASRSGDPYMDVVAGYLLLGALMRQGLWTAANKLMVELEVQIRSIAAGRFNDESRAMLGSIVLKRLAADARQGRLENVLRATEEAEEIAAASNGRDVLAYETTFGPSNIRIHEVHALLNIGDAKTALRTAGGFIPPTDLPGERRSHHYIDLAAAQLAVGDRDASLNSLLEARRIAPAHTRFHPTVRATAATLVRLDRAQREAVTGFARWASVS
ncbi:helix-turn-helix domain-containing protein [Actinomadura violacea]|uniref:Helix-turn-helix transcriptional regulator n=1 Tax=Actinomadura violacea TaxID=2819934 RepID=A0ABS3S4T5_9ACTN|nr:helix-turn-helix transcriptional regulator [Actinomadura violacea]MBO2464009.1 helix-turn-helix transcriptional regulator [Actinomadura violacea]